MQPFNFEINHFYSVYKQFYPSPIFIYDNSFVKRPSELNVIYAVVKVFLTRIFHKMPEVENKMFNFDEFLG